MACPFFEPQRRIGSEGWAPPPRFPLGDCWTGICHSPKASPFEPSDESLRAFCNFGYAGGACSHFPTDADCDAVRISGKPHSQTHIVLIREKNGVPVEFVELPLDAHAELDPITAAQIRAFTECHLDRENTTRLANAES